MKCDLCSGLLTKTRGCNTATCSACHVIWTYCSLTVCSLSEQVWITPSAQNCSYNISNGEWALNASHFSWL